MNAMNEFFSAALPWICTGVALAMLAVNIGIKNRKSHLAVGAAFGLLLGVTFNGCGLWRNHILGIVLGLLWGMALSTLYHRKESPDEGNDKEQ